MKLDKKYKVIVCSLVASNIILICVVINSLTDIKSYKDKIQTLSTSLKSEETLKNELEEDIKVLNHQYNLVRYDLDNDGFKSKVVFDPNNVTAKSNATKEQLLYGLKDTKLTKYVDTFLEVEQEYGINALAMIGLVANESGWLSSNRTINQNNVTGYAVYSDSAKGRTFSSIEESILVTAQTLAENYINPNGKYYEGLSTYDINVNYSADKDWCSIINSVALNILNDINGFVDFLYK